MPEITPPQSLPQWNINCPHPDKLETGDLLFPKKAEPDSHLESSKKSLSVKVVLVAGSGTKSVKDVLGIEFTQLLVSDVKSGLTIDLNLSLYENNKEESTTAQVDLSDPKNLFKLMRIAKAAFPHLIQQWLNMSMDAFVKHPVAQFLFKAMTAKDVKSGFFIGHVAMVIREADGELVNAPHGVPYVIEANITDFSHYRVSIHRYYVDDGTPISNATRGWVNRRCGLGESVWHSRPQYLGADTVDAAKNNAAKLAISNAAKALIGRSYGFFDNPDFGDIDRLYCSEFIYKAYQAVQQINVNDHRNWGWVQTFFSQTDPALGDLVKTIIDDSELGIDNNTKFFLLTPPMLWRSSGMSKVWPASPPYA
jgi:hypothetical protein